MVIDLTGWQQTQDTSVERETVAEHEQPTRERSVVATDHPGNRLIHQLFEEQVRRTPEAVAVTCEQERISYEELNGRANQLAHYLQAAGVGPGVLVGVCMQRSLATVVSILGVLKAGGGYVPLDPAYPAERLAFMLRDAQVGFLLTNQLDHPSDHPAVVISLDTAQEHLAHQSTTNPVSGVSSRDIAYVIYTSGSTGLPKGVLIEHMGFGNMITEQIRLFDIQPQQRIAQFASFSFDASVSEMFITLLAGAELHLIPQTSRWPASALAHYLQEHAITTITLPPSVLALLSTEELPGLQTVISAGEALSTEIAARWSNGRQMFNAYGPTEGTVCTTIGRCHTGMGRPSIGTPIAHTEVYLLDNAFQPVTSGAVGEVYIGGIGLARGYLNRPALTAEKFLPHPFSALPGARLYKTGDLARVLPDGSLECLGRTDRMVKIRGFRVELGEVEAVLEQHPLLLHSLVTVYKDHRGDRRLVAYVIAPQAYTHGVQREFLRQDVARFLQEKLPAYMLPASLVVLSSFPVTPNGKIDLHALLATDLDGQRLSYEKENT